MEKAGPVFCAGITMFTPLKTHGADKGGLNVGIMGKLSFHVQTSNVDISAPSIMGKKCRPKTPISLSYYSSSK